MRVYLIENPTISKDSGIAWSPKFLGLKIRCQRFQEFRTIVCAVFPILLKLHDPSTDELIAHSQQDLVAVVCADIVAAHALFSTMAMEEILCLAGMGRDHALNLSHRHFSPPSSG
jgi:hypothetical protein